MRSAEIISLAFFGAFTIAAAVVPLPRARTIRGIGIGVAGILIACLLPYLDALPGGATARDFIPAFLLLVAYWQTGQFVVGSDLRFQAFLERFDERWFAGAARLRRDIEGRRTVLRYLEGRRHRAGPGPQRAVPVEGILANVRRVGIVQMARHVEIPIIVGDPYLGQLAQLAAGVRRVHRQLRRPALVSLTALSEPPK